MYSVHCTRSPDLIQYPTCKTWFLVPLLLLSGNTHTASCTCSCSLYTWFNFTHQTWWYMMVPYINIIRISILLFKRGAVAIQIRCSEPTNNTDMDFIKFCYHEKFNKNLLHPMHHSKNCVDFFFYFTCPSRILLFIVFGRVYKIPFFPYVVINGVVFENSLNVVLVTDHTYFSNKVQTNTHTNVFLANG